MTRTARTLFGSFRERLSTAVFADGWWLFQALDVEIEGESHSSHELAAFLPECAAKALRPVPERADVKWFRDVAPVGLQLPARLREDAPLSLGFVACQVQSMNGNAEDIAYPFILVEREDRVLLQFSTSGPAPDIQRRIVMAFGQRLLWQTANHQGAAC